MTEYRYWHFLIIMLVSFFLTPIRLEGQEIILSPYTQENTLQNLVEVLESMELAYGIEFAFDSGLLPRDYSVDYNSEEKLETSLKKVFFLSNIEYRISQSTVLLRQVDDDISGAYLKGRVEDKLTKSALPYVLVHGEQTPSFYTDSLGYFKLKKTSIKDESLTFHFVGYRDRTVRIPAESIPLSIELESGLNKIPVIKITSPVSYKDRITIERLSPDRSYSFTSSIGGRDILRSIQLQPGIAAFDDVNAQIKIRGSESFETLIELDGIVIYNPTHFYNFFSAINDPYVNLIELYRNNMPIQFSGRTGGLVKMKSDELENSKFEVETDVDLLNAAINLKLPISNKSGFLFSARSSYTDLTNSGFFELLNQNNESSISDKTLANYLVQNLDPAYNYYDLNGKLQLNLSKGQKLDFNLYYSNDRLENIHSAERYNDLYSSKFIFDYAELSGWKNMGLSGNYSFSPAENQQSHLTINYSKSQFSEDFSFYNYIQNRNTEKKLNYSNDLTNELEDLHLRWHHLWEIKPGLLLTYGFESGLYQTNTLISTDTFQIYDKVTREIPIGFFQEFKGKHDRFEISIGSRLNHLYELDKTLFDPRLSILYHLGNQSGYLYSSFSINHQFLSQFSYQNHLGQDYSFWTLSTKDIPVLRSVNAMIGYKYKRKDLKFSAEAYVKKRNNITEFAILKPGLNPGNQAQVEEDQFHLFVGKGTITGIDLSLDKKIGIFETVLNYTLSTNFVEFDEIFNGQSYADPDHRLHQMKWLNNLKFKDFNFNINTIYSSGKPYFDISNLSKDVNRKDLTYKDQIKFLPYYFRLDTGIEYTKKISGVEVTLGLSLFNLTNRRNVYQVQYIRPLQINGQSGQFLAVGAESTLLDRTLNASISLKF